jgi:hypothetical protein
VVHGITSFPLIKHAACANFKCVSVEYLVQKTCRWEVFMEKLQEIPSDVGFNGFAKRGNPGSRGFLRGERNERRNGPYFFPGVGGGGEPYSIFLKKGVKTIFRTMTSKKHHKNVSLSISTKNGGGPNSTNSCFRGPPVANFLTVYN